MKNNKKNNRAFTLIEILVVISVIALLSSIVLGSLKNARIKANNAAINRLVMQYANALELYRAKNSSLPATPSGGRVCLGNYPEVGSFDCGEYVLATGLFSNYGNNTTLRDALSTYISSYPPVGTKKFRIDSILPPSGPRGWLGAVYASNLSTAPGGPAPDIYWFLEGVNQTCARPANTVVYSSTSNYLGAGYATRCEITLPK